MESYEELMLPLLLRLGGSEQQLHADELADVSPTGPTGIDDGYIAEEAANAVASAHRAPSIAFEE